MEVVSEQDMVWQANDGSAPMHLCRPPQPLKRELGPKEICRLALDTLSCTTYEEISKFGPPMRRCLVSNNVQIDYFVCYSWDDWQADTEMHLLKLQQVVTRFKRSHGREPTFWFDKICMPSRQYGPDGALKLLPVNLMACKRMLLLCGPSFHKRLWCIWELFVRNCFAPLDKALEDIEIIVVGNYSRVMEQLQQFDWKLATCYDPNEQANLHKTIRMVGGNAFNARVHRILADCSHRALPNPSHGAAECFENQS